MGRAHYPGCRTSIEVDYLDGHKEEIQKLFVHGLRASRLHYKHCRYRQMAYTIRNMADEIEDFISRVERGLEMDDSLYDLMLPERDANVLIGMGFETVGDIYYADAEHVDSGCITGGKHRPSIRISKAFKDRGMIWPVERGGGCSTAKRARPEEHASAKGKAPSTSRRKRKSSKRA